MYVCVCVCVCVRQGLHARKLTWIKVGTHGLGLEKKVVWVECFHSFAYAPKNKCIKNLTTYSDATSQSIDGAHDFLAVTKDLVGREKKRERETHTHTEISQRSFLKIIIITIYTHKQRTPIPKSFRSSSVRAKRAGPSILFFLKFCTYSFNSSEMIKSHTFEMLHPIPG